MNLKRRIVTGIATSAILLNVLTPIVFAETNVVISGNGAGSDNWANVTQSNTTTVTQNNTANVTNNVDADAKTGDNDANFNTGGTVVVDTGKATVKADIVNTLNSNAAQVDCCAAGSTDVKISGNGAYSDNGVKLDQTTTTAVRQNNVANVTNNVDADAETGENDANFNTGGDVIIGTGNATVEADIDNAVNFNYADVDCGCTWDVLAKIAGNGAEPDFDRADNIITLTLNSLQAVGQGNLSNLRNDLKDLDAKTGKNDVESNTGSVEGGDPAIVTGDALVDTGVNNSGNVNVVGDLMGIDWPEMPNVEFSFNFAALWAFLHMG